MDPSRRVATSPNVSRFLTNEGFNTLRMNRGNETSPSPQASTQGKFGFNRTLPTTMHIQIPEDNKPPQSITSRRKLSKPINTRMGVGKLATALSRLAFGCLQLNSKQMRREEGKTRMQELLPQLRISRVQSGFGVMYSHMLRQRRLKAFAIRMQRALSSYYASRLKTSLTRLVQKNNAKLSRAIQIQQKGKTPVVCGTLKRLINKRFRETISHLKLFTELYRTKLKTLRRLGNLFKAKIGQNTEASFHRISKAKRRGKQARGALSRPKQIRPDQPQPANQVSEQKYRRLQQDLKKTRQQLKQRDEVIRKGQYQRTHIQEETRSIKERVKIFQQTNKDLREKVQQLELQQSHLRQSRDLHSRDSHSRDSHSRDSHSRDSHSRESKNSHSPMSCQQDDNKSVYSVASKKSQRSNFSSRSFVENASMMSFNTMFMVKKLTGRTNFTKDCCQYRQKYAKLYHKLQQEQSKFEILQAEYGLIQETNKHLDLLIEGNLVGAGNNEETETIKRENIELKALIEGLKVQVAKLKADKEKCKKDFKKKLEEIYTKIVKKKSQSVDH